MRRGTTLRKVLEILPIDERPKLVMLLAALLLTGLIQTLGIASVMPFIALVTNPDLVRQDPRLAWAYELSGATEPRQFLLASGILVILLFASVNALAALTSWFSARFAWYNHHRVSELLLEQYLQKPYTFFLGRHGSRLSKTLLSEVKTVVSGVIMPALEVAAKCMTTLFVVGMLMWVDPWLSLLVSLALGGSYAAVYLSVRRRLRRLGHRLLEVKAGRYRAAAEAFGGIKDVKVLGREAEFVAKFRAPSLEYSKVEASQSVVAQLPGYLLDTLATGGMLAVLLYLLQTRQSLDQVLPIVAVYAVAGNRLLPTFQGIFAGLATVRLNAPAVDELYEDLDELPARGDSPRLPRASPAQPRTRRFAGDIEFRNVSFEYSRTRRPALNNVSLVVPRNTTVGLVGATGSGKTTLVDILLGLFTPTSGEVLVEGRRLDDSTVAEWRSDLGYVPQAIFLCDDTITRNVAFGVPDEAIDHAAVERAARAAHLHDFLAKLPEGYDTVVGERGVRLSGGERQRIGIARALYHDPRVLVMDEATSALDTVTEDAVMQATREAAQGRTVILIAHRLSTVRHCNAIFLMEGGTITAHGTYDELIATNQTFRAMAGLALAH